ncbi:MAG: class E sortase [Actinomycetota bacterium]|nr:class E sortase [Actinomycetota bacterium]
MATTAEPARTAGAEVRLPDASWIVVEPPPGPRRVPAHSARRRPLSPIRRLIREVGFDLITAGVIVLLFVGYQLWGTGLAEAQSQNQLKKQFSGQVAKPAAAPTPAPAPAAGSGGDSATVGDSGVALPGPPIGAAVAHLEIPKLGIDKYVVQGIGEEDLRKGPGHYPETPMPGEPGNAAIAGHRTTYGAPFYNIDKLAPGDDIYVTTAAGKFRYRVDHSLTVKPSDVSVLKQTGDNRLTLTTCTPKFEATDRLIVVAMLIDLPAPPAARVAPPPPASKVVAVNLGSGTSKALMPTLLYGLGFLALWAAVRILSSRRPSWRWVPFAIGIPLCAVPLWFVFENVIRLAPSNI